MAIIGELVPGRVPEHVRVNREGELRGFACALDHPQEPTRGDRCACLCDEDVRALAL